MNISKALSTKISKIGLLASSGLVAATLLTGVVGTATVSANDWGYGRGGYYNRDYDHRHYNRYDRHDRDCYKRHHHYSSYHREYRHDSNWRNY